MRAEFVLRPAGGGVDRSERWRSSRDSLIIKPRRTESECVVMVVVEDEFSLHMDRDEEEEEEEGAGWRSV